MAEEKLKVTLLVDKSQYEAGLREAGQEAQTFGTKLKGASNILKAGLYSTAAITALKVLTSAIKSTEGSSDKLEKTIGFVQGGLQGLYRTMVTGDWNNLITNITNTAAATRNLKVALDELLDITASNALRKSQLGDQLAQLRNQIAGTSAQREPEKRQALINDAINIQKQITALEVEEQQRRVDIYLEKYGKMYGVAENQYKNFQKNLTDIASNWNYYNSEEFRATMDYAISQYETLGSSGFVSEADYKKYKTTKEFLDLYVKIKETQGPDEFNKFIFELAKLNDLSANGEQALRRLITQFTTLGDQVTNTNREIQSFDKVWADMVGRGAEGKTGTWGTLQGMFADPTKLSKTTGAATSGDPYIERVNAQLQQQIILANELTGVFSNMFSVMGEGWAAMADALIESLQRIAQEIISKAAVWAIMQLIFPGSGAVGQFLPYITNGIFGNGGANGGLLGSVGSNQFGQQLQVVGTISGTNIALAGARGSNSLYNGT